MAERAPAHGWDGGNQMLDDVVEQGQQSADEQFSSAEDYADLGKENIDEEAQSPIEAAPPEAPTAPKEHIPSAELPEEDSKERLAYDGSSETPPGEVDGPDPETGVRVNLVDVDRAVDELAREIAEERLRTSAREGNRFTRLSRAVWRGTIGKEHDRQKYIREAREEIMAAGGVNLFAARDRQNPERPMGEAHRQAIDAVVTRLEAGFIRNGERYEELQESEASIALTDGMRDIIRRYADGEIGTEAMREERTRLLCEIQEEHPDFLDGAMAIADSFECAAEQVRAMELHGEALDRVIEGIEFYQARARMGADTEVAATRVDQLIERVNASRIGRFVSETTVASAIAIAYNGAQLASGKGVGMLLGTVAPGVAGGLIAGAREGASMRRDREQHIRQRATGAEQDLEGRRGRLEETRYETVDARASIDTIRTLLEVDGRTPEQNAELAALVSSIQARQEFGDEHNVDLVAFSSPEQVEGERLELYQALDQAMVQLTEWGQTASPEELAQIGAGEDIGEVLQGLRNGQAVELRTEVDARDRRFRTIRRQEIARAVIKGTLIGAAIGTVAQEVGAFAFSDRQGAVESLVKGGGGLKPSEAHKTLLASVLGVKTGGDQAPTGFHFERLRNGELVKLSDGTKIKHTETGMDFMRGNKVVAKDIEIGKGSVMSNATKESLAESGILTDSRTVITHERHRSVDTTAVKEFMKGKVEGTTRVERRVFLDNDTSGRFDFNELRLWWGSGGGVDKNGNYVLDVSHMTPKGSFHEGLSPNAAELAKDGKLKLLISADAAHQHKPFEIPINPSGKAVIDKDSTVGRSLFSRNGDRAISRARFIEVASEVGEDGGRKQMQIFATLEGKGVGSIRHVTEKVVPEVRSGIVLTDVGVEGGTDWPPIIPVATRREMAAAQYRRNNQEASDGDDDDEPTPPPPPPKPPKEPSGEPKISWLPINSLIGEWQRDLPDNSPKQKFSKTIMRQLMDARTDKAVDKLIEKYDAEGLRKLFNEDITDEQAEIYIARLQSGAIERKQELALEKRLKSKKTQKSIDKEVVKLIAEGLLIRGDDGEIYAADEADPASQFAKRVYNHAVENLRLRQEAERAAETVEGDEGGQREAA